MHLEPRAIRSKVSRWKDQEFGKEDDLVTTEILYDTDNDIPSEEEAVATDSSDSESTTSEDSEVSENDSPPPLSRKRKAPTPQKASSEKKRRRQKQADADATNATLSSRYPDSDQDDSEAELPGLVKKEPAVKRERSGSPALPRNPLTKKRPSIQLPDFSNKKRKAEIIDLTMDDSTDDEGRGGGRGAVQALGKKFAHLGGGKKKVKGKRGLCGVL